MKTSRIMAVAVLIVGSGLALHVALSQQPESSAPISSRTISACPDAK